MGRLLTLNFFVSVAASSRATRVSQQLRFPFRTKKVSVYFAAGVNRLMEISIYIAGDNTAPTTAEITGNNIFETFGDRDFIVGSDNIVTLEHEVDERRRGMYLKVHGNNADTFAHDLDVRVTIEDISEEERSDRPGGGRRAS